MSDNSARAANFKTFVDLLRWRAERQADKIAFTFLQDGEADELNITYGRLHRTAQAIAARLQGLGAEDGRAVLLYPPGLDFLAALLGCFYARVVAVPAYPPHLNRPMPQLQAIISDAQAETVLTTPQIHAGMERRFAQSPELKTLRWLPTREVDDAEAEDWRRPALDADTPAFFQYTSGSTSTPKGVMLSHGNLLYNERMIETGFRHTAETVFATWLPLFHDMGLIGQVLQSLYVGGRAVMMAPAAFLQKPSRWLRAISRYRANTAGSPNFGYEHCVARIPREERAGLDLSSWTIAFNGAEPIRRETFDRFAEAFEPYGFSPRAFYPCYGLAEACVFVSGDRKESPSVRVLDKGALEENKVIDASEGAAAKAVVGCGRSWLGQEIAVVDPESLARRGDAEIGEVWVSGANVAQGYWNKPEETAYTFRAFIPETGEGPFLRTGDLGFLAGGELFITGRLKDLIIIRGRNHYPQDIEKTAESSHPAMRPGAGAAFSVEVAGEERLVVVAEVGRHFDPACTPEVAAALRQQVADEHELETYAVVLLRTGTLPKTTSGKVQRRACRAGFLDGSLKAVGEWRQAPERLSVPQTAAPESPYSVEASTHDSSSRRRLEEAVRSWLVARIAGLRGVDASEVDVRKPFKSFALDSVTAVSLTGDLGAWLGRTLPATLMYEHPTVESLARHLAEETADSGPAADFSQTETVREPVAVVGIGCRFPGAQNAEEFWRVLREGVDAVTEVPEGRWNARAFYAPSPASPGKMNTRWGGFLERVDEFDASLFGIAPREAAFMDPQQRLLLEVAWEALEDAGQAADKLAGTSTGVFLGLSGSDYASFQLRDPSQVDAYATTGNALSIAANRLSYFFDLRGPSITVDTACSSSLVAVHLACQSLWRGESKLALAGGSNLILSPAVTVGFSQAGATSPHGRCKAFDAKADGIVRSEGVGVVVLKVLSRAVADGDPVYAVIRGSAVNQDGRSNGITSPNRAAQEAVLWEAYRDAGVSPGQVRYVETHGTGTLLGDPIEAGALGKVLAQGRPQGDFCAIGSVKSNIGHTEAAAGIASLIKVSLALKHGELPPSLHFGEPNPHIPFADLQLRVPQRLEAWPADSSPLVAGVSAFGFGGTNAHVVLEEAPPTVAAQARARGGEENESVRPLLLPLSAHRAEALQALAREYRAFISSEGKGGEVPFERLCSNAALRRTHHDHRLAVVARSTKELDERLVAFLAGETRRGMSAGRRLPSRGHKLAFIFSGYGAQWWGMGRDLLQHEPVFRAAVERCDELLLEHADWSLLEELLADKSHSRLDGSNVEVTQVCLFALQVGLAALWRSWGVEPDAVAGHSLGEVAAAHVSGALDLPSAVRVIALRGRLMGQGVSRLDGAGAMASIDLSPEEARPLLEPYGDRLSIAVQNSPSTLVVAGEKAALENFLQDLRRERGVVGQLLHTPGAGHSPQVEPLRAELEEALRGLSPRPSAVPFYSTVTGGVSDGGSLGASYWGRNVREPVLFADAVRQLAADGFDTFVEFSPHPILSPPITECLTHLGREGAVIPSLRLKREDRSVMLGALGQLYASGYPVDWGRLYGRRDEYVKLPAYPFQRERYWVDERRLKNNGGAQGRRAAWDAGRQLPGQYLQPAGQKGTHCWEMELSAGQLPYLAGPRVHGKTLIPAAAYMEIAITAAEEVFGVRPRALDDLNIHEALVLPESQATGCTVQLVISSSGSGEAAFQFFSFAPDRASQQPPWTLHADGKIRLPATDRAPRP